MRIYSKHTRRMTRYYLRVLRTDAIDYWTLAMALTALLALLFMPHAAAPMALIFIRLRWGDRFECGNCGWEGEWSGTRCPKCGK